MRRLRLALASLLLVGFVLPGDRVLDEIAEIRGDRPPLRIDATLAGASDSSWPTRVTFDLHPDLGYRVSDEFGGRWLVRGGKVLASSEPRIPEWIPALEILALRAGDELRAWLDWAKVEYRQSSLGRCGESDCFVLGGIRAGRQLWVEKDRFEVLRWVAGRGRGIEFAQYRNWDGQRFPAEIRVINDDTAFAVFSIQAVRADPSLGAGDFSVEWARTRTPRPVSPAER